MFANRHITHAATTNYNLLGEWVVDNYGEAGGGNSIPGCDILPSMVKRNDLVVFVSDFGFREQDIEEAGEILTAVLPAAGCQVATIVMFTEMCVKKLTGLKYNFCKDIEDLAGVAIETVAKRFCI